MASSGAAIPTVIECNPTGTSPPAGVRLSYFGEKSVAEVTACLAQGSQPMLVGCTADTIDMVVKVSSYCCQAMCSHLLTPHFFGLHSALSMDIVRRCPYA